MFGLWPRFVVVCCLLFASLSPLAKRKSGWGICGSSLSVWLWFLLLLLQSICRFQGLFVLAFAFQAYSHVRTEPQRDIGHTRGKKKRSKLGIQKKGPRNFLNASTKSCARTRWEPRPLKGCMAGLFGFAPSFLGETELCH